jgi:hypothetical protein
MPLVQRNIEKSTDPGKGTIRSQPIFYVHPRKVEPADVIVVPHGRRLLDLQLQHPEEFGTPGGPYTGPTTLAELRAILATQEPPKKSGGSIAPPPPPPSPEGGEDGKEKPLSAGEPVDLEGMPEGYSAYQFPGGRYELFVGDKLIPSGSGEGRFRGKTNVIQAAMDHFAMSQDEI